jgi:Tol biopolymer transport system component
MNRRLAMLGLAALLIVGTHCQDSSAPAPEVLFPIHHDWPSWSRNGIVVFHSYGVSCVNPTTGSYQIDNSRAGLYSLDLATDSLRFVLRGGNEAAWSPAGDRLAAALGGQLCVVEADGSSRHDMGVSGQCGAPSWSPDGLQLAYHTTAASPRGRLSIWIVDLADESSRNVSGVDAFAFSPSWAMNGNILHDRLVPDVGYQVFTMNTDGGSLVRRSVDPAVTDLHPRYSPDGLHIVYVSQGREGNGHPRLVLAEADGSNSQVLSNVPADHPAWSPDGQSIVFVRMDTSSNDPGNGVLWVIDVSSRAMHQLTWAERGPCN